MGDGKRFSDVSSAWENVDCDNLTAASVTDIYDNGETKSITVRFTFSSDDRTLSMDEVQPVIDKIVNNLAQIGVNLRA